MAIFPFLKTNMAIARVFQKKNYGEYLKLNYSLKFARYQAALNSYLDWFKKTFFSLGFPFLIIFSLVAAVAAQEKNTGQFGGERTRKK